MINEPIKVPTVSIRPGDTFSFPDYQLTQENDQPVNFSGWIFSAVWRKKEGAEKTVEITVDASDVVDGVFRLSINNDRTESMTTNGFWVLVASLGTPETVKTLLIGRTRVLYA